MTRASLAGGGSSELFWPWLWSEGSSSSECFLLGGVDLDLCNFFTVSNLRVRATKRVPMSLEDPLSKKILSPWSWKWINRNNQFNSIYTPWIKIHCCLTISYVLFYKAISRKCFKVWWNCDFCHFQRKMTPFSIFSHRWILIYTV